MSTPPPVLLCDEVTVLHSIASFYNALPGQNQKDLVEKWAQDAYPHIWTELEKLGQRTTKEGHRIFKMNNFSG